MGDGLTNCISGVASDNKKQLQGIENHVAALAADYHTWAGEELKAAKQALETAWAMPSGRQPHIEKIFAVTHDMKGQGSTFGYDLITSIGELLTDFIRDIPDATDRELKVIDQHLAAMAMVLDKQIKGTGGPFADKIRAKLEHIATAARG